MGAVWPHPQPMPWGPAGECVSFTVARGQAHTCGRSLLFAGGVWLPCSPRQGMQVMAGVVLAMGLGI